MILSSRKTRRLQTVVLLLIAAFLCVQWAFSRHQADIEKHHSQHQCEWCLVHGHVGDAVADSDAQVAGSRLHLYLQNNLRTGFAGVTCRPYGARAPPATLHI